MFKQDLEPDQDENDAAGLTATHETGFGLWQSDVNPYCLKAVKWRNGKGDIVRDLVILGKKSTFAV